MTSMLLAIAPDTAAPAATWLQQMLQWANATEPWQIWIVVFGVGAQSLFFARWLVQWFVSEKRGESHIPVAFWWLSLAGATLLMVYFILRHEPVGILGQSVGWVVYFRNLRLIGSRRTASSDGER